MIIHTYIHIRQDCVERSSTPREKGERSYAPSRIEDKDAHDQRVQGQAPERISGFLFGIGDGVYTQFAV